MWKLERLECGLRPIGAIRPTPRREVMGSKIATDTHRHFFVKIVSMVWMVEMVWNVKNIMFVSSLLFEFELVCLKPPT
jgi:hypothetical protein